jgi:glycosyltransferase involved in cell wall biosynthesis
MRRIKVVYVIDTLEVGGAEKSLVQLALANQGVEPVFISLYTGNALQNILEFAGVKVYALHQTYQYKFSKVAAKLLPILQTEQPEIVHSTLFRADMVCRKLYGKINTKWVSSFVNNSYISDRFKSLSLLGKCKLKAVQWLDAYTARRVDGFIANSATVAKSNSIFLQVPLHKIEVIYRGREVATYTSVDPYKVEGFRANYEISPEDFLFVNVSRLLPRKGQLDLLRAFSIVSKQVPKARLLIAGEGAFRTELESFIRNNRLENSVRLLGNVQDIPSLLSASHAFVFPSYYEGLPGALIEAMLAGCNIICSNIPENLECVDDSSAIIVEKGDIRKLADEMINVCKGSTSKTMAMNAAALAIQKFSLPKVVEQYNQYYKKLLAR